MCVYVNGVPVTNKDLVGYHQATIHCQSYIYHFIWTYLFFGGFLSSHEPGISTNQPVDRDDRDSIWDQRPSIWWFAGHSWAFMGFVHYIYIIIYIIYTAILQPTDQWLIGGLTLL